jgi:hypothetical protein
MKIIVKPIVFKKQLKILGVIQTQLEMLLEKKSNPKGWPTKLPPFMIVPVLTTKIDYSRWELVI